MVFFFSVGFGGGACGGFGCRRGTPFWPGTSAVFEGATEAEAAADVVLDAATIGSSTAGATVGAGRSSGGDATPGLPVCAALGARAAENTSAPIATTATPSVIATTPSTLICRDRNGGIWEIGG